jgi:hypothetical protein
MPLNKGTVNFSVLRTTTAIDVGFADELVGESYKEDVAMGDEGVIDISGGVSLLPPPGRSVAEGTITRDDFLHDSIPFFAVRKRELKIDSSMAKEMIARAIEEKRLSGVEITRKTLKEIKQVVRDALASKASVKITGTRAVFSPTGFCFVESTSVKKSLDFAENLSSLVSLNVLGTLNLVDFGYIASSLKFDPSAYCPMQFSQHETTCGLGEDFLTFLLYASSQENVLGADVQLSVPGFIEMTDCTTSTAGAKIISMKDGIPFAGREVSSCIKSGKKVSALEIAVQFGQSAFTAIIDSNFCVKKFTAVKGDEEEAEETLADRVMSMDQFTIGISKLFSTFIGKALNDQRGLATSIREWSVSE